MWKENKKALHQSNDRKMCWHFGEEIPKFPFPNLQNSNTEVVEFWVDNYHQLCDLNLLLLFIIVIITTTTIYKAISVLPWRFQDKIHRKLLHVTQYILSTHQSLLLILLGSKGSLELRVPLISLTNWAVFHPQMESKQCRKHKWKV